MRIDSHEEDPRWREFFGSSERYTMGRLHGGIDYSASVRECARCHALVPYISTIGHINWHAAVDTAATVEVPLTKGW